MSGENMGEVGERGIEKGREKVKEKKKKSRQKEERNWRMKTNKKKEES